MDVRETGKDFNTVIDRHQLEPFTPILQPQNLLLAILKLKDKKCIQIKMALMNKGKTEKAQAHPDTLPNVSSQLSEILAS